MASTNMSSIHIIYSYTLYVFNIICYAYLSSKDYDTYILQQGKTKRQVISKWNYNYENNNTHVLFIRIIYT